MLSCWLGLNNSNDILWDAISLWLVGGIPSQPLAHPASLLTGRAEREAGGLDAMQTLFSDSRVEGHQCCYQHCFDHRSKTKHCKGCNEEI